MVPSNRYSLGDTNIRVRANPMVHLHLVHQRFFYYVTCLTCVLVLAVVSPTNGHAKTTIYEEVTEFDWIAEKIREQAKRNHGNSLVVFDIDDTLLESEIFFGGDTWYNWQRGQLISDQEGNSIQIKSEDVMSCIFAKLGTLYELGNYKVTDSNAPKSIAELQQVFDTMALTSRSPDYRPGTERELKDAGISFEQQHLLLSDLALVYDFSDSADSSPRPISYSKGIVMSTGLNKGRVLRDLLRRVNRSYTNVFFIDDARHNVDQMNEEYSGDPDTHVQIFHYTRVSKTASIEKLQKARQAGRELMEFITIAFPSRAEEFANRKCY